MFNLLLWQRRHGRWINSKPNQQQSTFLLKKRSSVILTFRSSPFSIGVTCTYTDPHNTERMSQCRLRINEMPV